MTKTRVMVSTILAILPIVPPVQAFRQAAESGSFVACLPQSSFLPGVSSSELERAARNDPETLAVGLLDAASNGNLSCVRKLLSIGAPPNGDGLIVQGSVAGQTPLVAAAQAGSAPVVRALLEGGADPNLRALAIPELKKVGVPPLNAAIPKSVEAAKILIEKGANINAADDSGLTPLHWAATKGNLELVRLLVTRGARLDAKDTVEGLTPLEKAKAFKHQSVVKYLQSVGSAGKRP